MATSSEPWNGTDRGDRPKGRAMTRSQSQMVDNAFEEGHYELGIEVLSNICNTGTRIDPPFIRQLLYMGLYPSPPEDKTKTVTSQQLNSSPSALTTATTRAAWDLLYALTKRLSPSALLHALPSYPSIGEVRQRSPGLDRDGDAYGAASIVARESMRFSACQSCWSILREGFIPVLGPTIRTLPGSPSKRSRASFSGGSQWSAPSQIVGQNSWEALRWLILLFEKDEREAHKVTGILYSPLLLTEVPATRSERGAKWDVTIPLDIVFFCLKDNHQRELGRRLLELLVHLTFTPDFDSFLFINLLSTKLSVETQDTDDILAQLPDGLKFSICKALLSTSSENSSRRPRQGSKAQPRRKAPDRREGLSQTTSMTLDAPNSTSLPSSGHQPILPPASVVMQLFRSDTVDVWMLNVKFHLLVSYIALQSEADESISQGWADMVQRGEVQQAVEAVFCPSINAGVDEAVVFKEIVTTMVTNS